MEAKDGSMGFDFEGRFTSVIDYSEIEYELEDKRKVLVTFSEVEGGTKVVEIFDSEDEDSAELQRQGWQSILNNLKKHVESD